MEIWWGVGGCFILYCCFYCYFDLFLWVVWLKRGGVFMINGNLKFIYGVDECVLNNWYK